MVQTNCLIYLPCNDIKWFTDCQLNTHGYLHKGILRLSFLKLPNELLIFKIVVFLFYPFHYYINKIKGVRIEHVKDLPMWCEVIHDRNMGNDAYFLRAKMVRDADGFGFMVRQAHQRIQVSGMVWDYICLGSCRDMWELLWGE